jgi:UDP-4-amino-4,6-dideoxy-N-acetyl-beta-L-altrosamine N-acetyltransferase
MQAPNLIRAMTISDLEKVFNWRNHPDVRLNMFSQHELSFEEHSNWFELASKDARRHLLVYEADSSPIGFINFNVFDSGGIAEWGFYSAPDAPKGTGYSLGIAALNYAFTSLGLHKLCGQVINYNLASINFHLKLGFIKEGILKEQFYDGQNYHDVCCFGLLAKSWLSQKPEVLNVK